MVSAAAKLPRHKLTLPNTNTDANLSLAITKSDILLCQFYFISFNTEQYPHSELSGESMHLYTIYTKLLKWIMVDPKAVNIL